MALPLSFYLPWARPTCYLSKLMHLPMMNEVPLMLPPSLSLSLLHSSNPRPRQSLLRPSSSTKQARNFSLLMFINYLLSNNLELILQLATFAEGRMLNSPCSNAQITHPTRTEHAILYPRRRKFITPNERRRKRV